MAIADPDRGDVRLERAFRRRRLEAKHRRDAVAVLRCNGCWGSEP